MKIKRMNVKGKVRFIQFLVSLKTDQPQEFPLELLTSSSFADVIGGDTTSLDDLDLEDKLSTAKGLDEIVKQLELTSAEKDWGFWTWCSAYLFARLCKKKGGGKFAPGEIPIWVAEPLNWKRYYRHYLASIWQVYAAHREKKELEVLLTGPVNIPGELWGQFAGTQTLITNASMIDVVYHLYWDKDKFERKRGAGGESPRRLNHVLKQFELTYDFFAMSGAQIVSLLPHEFDRFRE